MNQKNAKSQLTQCNNKFEPAMYPSSLVKKFLLSICQNILMGLVIAVLICAAFYIALVQSDKADQHRDQVQAQVRAEVVK